jgi:hypothetical protein
MGRRGRGWQAAVVAALAAGACGHRPPPPIAETAAPASDAPPPRGQPPPRLGHLPLPGPGPGDQPSDAGEQQERFRILQGQARKEANQRQGAQRAGRIELAGGRRAVEVCDTVPAADRVNCPLRPEAIERVVDIPHGVRIALRKGPVSAEELQRTLACQTSLAQAAAREPSWCPFIDARTTPKVVTRHGQVAVELTTSGDVDPLREEVRGYLRGR